MDPHLLQGTEASDEFMRSVRYAFDLESPQMHRIYPPYPDITDAEPDMQVAISYLQTMGEWDSAVQDEEFRWHKARKPLNYIYHSRHCYPLWKQLYEYKLGAIILRLYPEYDQPHSSIRPFELSDYKRETIRIQLDRERDTSLDQPEEQYRSSSQSSTEDYFSLYVEADENDVL
eukprot:g33995.t1